MVKREIFAIVSGAMLLMAMAPSMEQDLSKCTYEKDAMLALSYNEFDQNPDTGWRKVAEPGCEEVAADLIIDWRTHHNRQDKMLFWHEGQLRAEAGQYQSAVALFKLSRKTRAEDRGWGWNIYVNGSIAFLQGNKRALQKAKRNLANLRKPKNMGRSVDINGNPVEVEWPLNLHILEGFNAVGDKAITRRMLALQRSNNSHSLACPFKPAQHILHLFRCMFGTQ
jgi:hypothetical protein